MKKSLAMQWPYGSMERVVLHGAWQESRGRNPSEPYGNIDNPKGALAQARDDLAFTDTSLEEIIQDSLKPSYYEGVSKLLVCIGVDCRAAERQHKLATRERDASVNLASQEGMSIRKIGQNVGLSPARVQQITKTQK